jgi:hypothetical protein
VWYRTTLQPGRSRQIPSEVRGVFKLPHLSSRTLALGSTQHLKKRVPEIFLGFRGGRAACKADITAICQGNFLANMGVLTTQNPVSLHGLSQAQRYLSALPTTSVPHRIQTRHLQNTNRKCCHVTKLPGYKKRNKNKLRGLQSASELYRLSDRHLLPEFSANFCG